MRFRVTRNIDASTSWTYLNKFDRVNTKQKHTWRKANRARGSTLPKQQAKAIPPEISSDVPTLLQNSFSYLCSPSRARTQSRWSRELLLDAGKRHTLQFQMVVRSIQHMLLYTPRTTLAVLKPTAFPSRSCSEPLARPSPFQMPPPRQVAKSAASAEWQPTPADDGAQRRDKTAGERLAGEAPPSPHDRLARLRLRAAGPPVKCLLALPRMPLRRHRSDGDGASTRGRHQDW